jgi:hypothetical protein
MIVNLKTANGLTVRRRCSAAPARPPVEAVT